MKISDLLTSLMEGSRGLKRSLRVGKATKDIPTRMAADNQRLMKRDKYWKTMRHNDRLEKIRRRSATKCDDCQTPFKAIYEPNGGHKKNGLCHHCNLDAFGH